MPMGSYMGGGAGARVSPVSKSTVESTGTPNSTGPRVLQKGNPPARAPSGASVPFNNTPNENPVARGATTNNLTTPNGAGSKAHQFNYPTAQPQEVGPISIDMMDYGPNSSGMRPLQGTASKR